MSWVAGDDHITFKCDSGCGRADVLDVATAAEAFPRAPSEFAAAWLMAERDGWFSLKRGGSPWTYHCPGCRTAAQREHDAYRERERARERIRSRNSR